MYALQKFIFAPNLFLHQIHFCQQNVEHHKMFKQKVLTTNFCKVPILTKQLFCIFYFLVPPIRIGTTQNIYTVASANCVTFCYGKWPCQNAFCFAESAQHCAKMHFGIEPKCLHHGLRQLREAPRFFIRLNSFCILQALFFAM